MSATVFVSPTPDMADRLGLPPAPLPVSQETADSMASGRVECAAIAMDVDNWLNGEPRGDAVERVLSRYVATLSYVAAVEFLDHDRPDLASAVLRVGVRHLPDDPSLRATLGLALWDDGARYDGLAQLVLATQLFTNAGQLSFHLWVLTARALSEAGRHREAVELLEQVADQSPRLPIFWDLLDTIEQRI